MAKRIFVSGHFDVPDSGHIAFLQATTIYSDLDVALELAPIEALWTHALQGS